MNIILNTQYTVLSGVNNRIYEYYLVYSISLHTVLGVVNNRTYEYYLVYSISLHPQTPGTTMYRLSRLQWDFKEIMQDDIFVKCDKTALISLQTKPL